MHSLCKIASKTEEGEKFFRRLHQVWIGAQGVAVLIRSPLLFTIVVHFSAPPVHMGTGNLRYTVAVKPLVIG
jgi:hypothetical protein